MCPGMVAVCKRGSPSRAPLRERAFMSKGRKLPANQRSTRWRNTPSSPVSTLTVGLRRCQTTLTQAIASGAPFLAFTLQKHFFCNCSPVGTENFVRVDDVTKSPKLPWTCGPPGCMKRPFTNARDALFDSKALFPVEFQDWIIGGNLLVVYAKDSLPVSDRLRAAEKLARGDRV
jgi:hypothetical protein